MMVENVREITVKKSCMANMDCLKMCYSCFLVLLLLLLLLLFLSICVSYGSLYCVAFVRLTCKSMNIGDYTQTVQPNVFILAMLIGIIDFSTYHFRRLSLTLTLPGDHKVSVKQKLLALFSPTLLHLIRMKSGEESQA